MTDIDGRCGSCAAFTRSRVDPERGRVGECALEVFPPPVSAGSTCSRYRPKGASAPAPRPRAAGEPRRSGTPRPAAARGASSTPEPSRPPLPEEIDIDMDIDEFRRVLRDVLAEELGITTSPIAPRWQGGEAVLFPGKQGTQEKRIPLDAFFHKIVMIRDKLRVLEQKINSHDGLSDTDKVQLQAYITGCYGSLTTFNLLFADREDAFAGASKD
ncbi:MAG: hypothetical protein R3B70_35645 [Polyangiaceae bacterium]